MSILLAAASRKRVVASPVIQQARIVPPDITAEYGYFTALSYDGNTAAICARNDQANGEFTGAIYILVRHPVTRAWSQQTKLLGSVANQELGFWMSLSDDGNTLLAGTASGGGGTPRAFKRVGTSWSELTVPNPSVTAGLGFADGSHGCLSADGNRFILSSQFQAVSGTSNVGAAFIYNRSGDAFAEATRLTHASPGINHRMGYRSAISGNGLYAIVVAGNNASGYLGVVYFFNGSAWSQQQTLGGLLLGGSGAKVAVDNSGQYAFLLDPLYNSPAVGSNRVAVFERAGAVWSGIATVQAANKLSARNGLPNLSCSRDGRLLVGHSYDSLNVNDAAALFRKAGSAWPLLKNVKGRQQFNNDQAYATALSGDGKTMIVGAQNADPDGAVYIFTSSDNLA